MISVLSLLTVLILSLLVVRVATVVLTLTGLSRELARFQARSAFSGAGFTTRESEQVVQHPVRRRVIMLLMLLGNAGIVTAISSLIASFTTADGDGWSVWVRMSYLTIGLTVLWTAAHSRWLDRRLSRLITWALKRWTQLEVRDYAGLLHLSGDYAVVELCVQEDDWLEGQTLQKLRLSEEGVLVLGIEKPDGNYLGAPRGQNELLPDDTVLLYGPKAALQNLDTRKRGNDGNRAHVYAVEKQRNVEKRERKFVESDAESPSPG